MKNIIAETPVADLHGRLKFSVGFVDPHDIRGKSVLDIGCGYGWFELHALKRGVKKITATEVSEPDLSTIRKNLHHPQLVINVASAIKLPYPKDSFDTVVCWEVLEHIPKGTENTLFFEVARVLKPGGAFYLSTPSNNLLSRIFDPAWWLIGHRHYSPNQLQAFGSSSKLIVDNITVRGRYWELVAILNMYFSKWILHRLPLFSDALIPPIDREWTTEGFVDLFAKFTKPIA